MRQKHVSKVPVDSGDAMYAMWCDANQHLLAGWDARHTEQGRSKYVLV